MEIIQACIEQKKWHAAIKLIELLQNMDQNNKDSVLLEIRLAP